MVEHSEPTGGDSLASLYDANAMAAHPRTGTGVIAPMLNLFLLLRPGGYISGSWRMPETRIEEAGDFSLYRDMTVTAERGGFDAVFFADALSLYDSPADHIAQPVEPITMLSALATVTTRVGLVATISTTYSEPYNVARQLAQLDRISDGRAGWNVVTTTAPSAAANFGTSALPQHAARYARADEFQAVAKRLWLSWDADAIAVDRAAGTQTRPGSIRPIDFSGEHFTVAGPLNIPRTPQEWPLMVHAGQSADGLAVALRNAEVLFGVQHDINEAAAFVQRVREGLRQAGRPENGLRVLPGLNAIIGDTAKEAEELDRELRRLGGESDIDSELSWVLGFDVREAPQDSVVDPTSMVSPETISSSQTWYSQVHTLVSERPQTVREVRDRLKQQQVGRSGHLRLVGTPEMIADELVRWHNAGAAHGFVVQPPMVPQSVDDFAAKVIPILRERGVVQNIEDQPGVLRDRLGLPGIRENFPSFFESSLAPA